MRETRLSSLLFVAHSASPGAGAPAVAARRRDRPGVDEAGGEVLSIEATLLPASSGLTLTGQLGAVMQESAKAHRAYPSHAEALGIDRALFKDAGVHIHVPAGAIPKEAGPPG